MRKDRGVGQRGGTGRRKGQRERYTQWNIHSMCVTVRNASIVMARVSSMGVFCVLACKWWLSWTLYITAGLSPGGRVKLARSACVDLASPRPRSFTLTTAITTHCLAFHPQQANHYYVGTDEVGGVGMGGAG